jgi:hypothetical protein
MGDLVELQHIWDRILADDLDKRGLASTIEDAVERVEEALVGACEELGLDRAEIEEQPYRRARRELTVLGRVVAMGIDPQSGETIWCRSGP